MDIESEFHSSYEVKISIELGIKIEQWIRKDSLVLEDTYRDHGNRRSGRYRKFRIQCSSFSLSYDRSDGICECYALTRHIGEPAKLAPDQKAAPPWEQLLIWIKSKYPEHIESFF